MFSKVRVGLVLLVLMGTPALAQSPEVTLQELIDAYRLNVQQSRERLKDASDRLTVTLEYKAFEAARSRTDKLEAELSAVIKAKTGKTIDWPSGALK